MLDLRTCEAGMSCDEYSTLVMAGLNSDVIPPAVRMRMARHHAACAYHQSQVFVRSAVNSYPTEEVERAAMVIIEKYSSS